MANTESTVEMTNRGFDWGDMAVERCFEDKGFRCVRIRSISTGRYLDVRLSPKGRHLYASVVRKDKRLRGYDPCGGKETFEQVFRRLSPPQTQRGEREMTTETFNWPWFYCAAPTFDAEKLTRPPNLCMCCEAPMVDFGNTQIIYGCVNQDCKMSCFMRESQQQLDMLMCEF